jgi:hypothetical protein
MPLPALGLSRREALWEAKALVADRPLPLFAGDIEGEGIVEPAAHLPDMTLGEQVVEDYVLRQWLLTKGRLLSQITRGICDQAMKQAGKLLQISLGPAVTKNIACLFCECDTRLVNFLQPRFGQDYKCQPCVPFVRLSRYHPDLLQGGGHTRHRRRAHVHPLCKFDTGQAM